MQKDHKNYFKYSLTLILCLLVRLIPLRAPNVEPILATTMPIGRLFGKFSTFSFAVLSILLYDIITHTIGVQTIFTATAYGVLALWATHYFKNKKGKTIDYISFAVMGTLFFDAATGLTVGPIFFHQSFMASLMGQIPFTLLHLVSNVVLAATLSPVIYNFLIRKKIYLPSREYEEQQIIINTFNPKTI